MLPVNGGNITRGLAESILGLVAVEFNLSKSLLNLVGEDNSLSI